MARFATTRWSIILDARQPGAARGALEELCSIYRMPVLQYIRRHGYATDDAEDLTQEFFRRFLEGRWDIDADPDRGHFRGLLLTALKRFLASTRQAAHACKRGGGMHRIDEQFVQTLPDDGVGPEEAFEHAWAVTVLERAMARLRAEAESAGKGELFRQLSPYVGAAPDAAGYRTIAEQLGLRPNTVAVAVHRLRTRLRELVQEELVEQCDGPERVAAELEALRGAFHRAI